MIIYILYYSTSNISTFSTYIYIYQYNDAITLSEIALTISMKFGLRRREIDLARSHACLWKIGSLRIFSRAELGRPGICRIRDILGH
jgi:hypothetical protein